MSLIFGVLASFVATHDVVDTSRVELRQSSQHPMRYYLATPAGYHHQHDGQSWPVLVCVAGSSSDFQELAEKYRVARNNLPFILVAPCTFSNTNALEGVHLQLYRRLYSDAQIADAERDRLAWNEAGLLAVLDDLEKELNAQHRIHMTGFSGGGILTYHMLLRHPERLVAAAPVCANYFGDIDSAHDAPLSSQESATPIRLLLGEMDTQLEHLIDKDLLQSTPWVSAGWAVIGLGIGYLTWRRTGRARWLGLAGALGLIASASGLWIALWWNSIDPQSRNAIARLRSRGYMDVTVTIVPGMRHEPAADRVVSLFRQSLMTD